MKRFVEAREGARRVKRFVDARDGARLCVESFGAPDDPALLLIAGAASAMDWWEDDLCRRLAERGRLVVRYDHRDTGESTSYPPGAPGYGGPDLVTDALAVLDGLGVDRAHVVGLSMGGSIALSLALDHRDRVATLTLMSTSSVGPGQDGLPGAAPAVQALFADDAPEPDWSDRAAVVDHLVEGERPYAGRGEFDEPRVRAIAERVVDRSRDVAANANHFLATGGDPVRPRLPELAGLPTLVLHGTADPLFPLPHGRALADEIPGAELVELDGVGHQYPPPRTWDRVVDLLAAHTVT